MRTLLHPQRRFAGIVFTVLLGVVTCTPASGTGLPPSTPADSPAPTAFTPPFPKVSNHDRPASDGRATPPPPAMRSRWRKGVREARSGDGVVTQEAQQDVIYPSHVNMSFFEGVPRAPGQGAEASHRRDYGEQSPHSPGVRGAAAVRKYSRATGIHKAVAAGLTEAQERLEAIKTALATFERQLKKAHEEMEGDRQAFADLRHRLDRELEKWETLTLRLDALGTELQRNAHALKAQKSRLEDNSVKLYETLIDIDAMKKEVARLRHAYAQMKSTHAEMRARVTTGEGDRALPGRLLPLVLCLLAPLAVVINQGGLQAAASPTLSEDRSVAGILVGWFTGGAGFFLFGIGILYGPGLGGVMGNPLHFLGTLLLSAPAKFPAALPDRLISHLVLASIFAVVACSSVSRGRLTNRGYFLVAIVAGTLVYPLFGHWIATPSDLSPQPGWLTLSACSTATTHVALLGGILALSLASGLGLIRRAPPDDETSPAAPAGMTTAGAMLLWFAWIGVILISNADCLPLAVLPLTLGAVAGGAALGVLLADAATAPSSQWQSRAPFAVLAGIAAAPVGAHGATLSELAVLGALTSVSASLLMRLFAPRSMADIGPASALLVGGTFGTLAPALFGATGFLSVHAVTLLMPQIEAMGVALLLGLFAGRALAWTIRSTRFLRISA